MPGSRPVLDQAAMTEALAQLPRWTVEQGHLCRALRFPTFAAAFGFMAAVALEAERLGHHPKWTNCYNTVEIELWTHDSGGVTSLDLVLAERIERHITTP